MQGFSYPRSKYKVFTWYKKAFVQIIRNLYNKIGFVFYLLRIRRANFAGSRRVSQRSTT